MAKSYRLRTNMEGYAQGETVTADDIKAKGWDADDLVKRGAIEVHRAGAAGDDDGPVGDEANKERIEQRVRDESVRLGRPLEPHEQNKIAAEVTKESAAQTKDATKDAAKEQQAANKDAARRDATQPPKSGK